MVYLHLDISGQSSSLVLDLLINQSDKLLFHLVGRYQQLLETNRSIGALDEIEDSCHLLRQFRVGRHQDAIGVHPGIPLMEITGAHASDVFSGSHLDMGDLGVYFQSLHTKNHMHTRILQLL